MGLCQLAGKPDPRETRKKPVVIPLSATSKATLSATHIHQSYSQRRPRLALFLLSCDVSCDA